MTDVKVPYPDEASAPPSYSAAPAPMQGSQHPYPPQPYPAQPSHGQAQPQPQNYNMQPQGVYIQAPTQQTITHVTSPIIPPSDYFGLALFVTICCCLPLGIVGLVKASEVKNRAAMGDAAGAHQSSREAHRYSMIGLGIGIAFWVLGLILTIVYVVVIVNIVSTSIDINDGIDTDSVYNNY